MNVLSRQRKVAERFIAPLKKNPKVLGIAFLGSLARHSGDLHSDIDIAIFSADRLDDLHRGESKMDGWTLDVYNVAINSGWVGWSDPQREAYAECELVHDPRGDVALFLSGALAYSPQLKTTRAVEILLQLGWNGFSYSPAQGRHWKGYLWELPSDLWIQRGSPSNAFYVLRQSFELVVSLLYVINCRWLPDAKWRLLKTNNLSWTPPGWSECQQELLTASTLDEPTFRQKAAILQRTVDLCYERLMPDLPQDMYALFMEISRDYS